MEEEQVYTIPLRKAQKTPRKKRASKAVKLVKDFLKKHMKVNQVKIGPSLNQEIWEKGAEKPPERIRVRAIKENEYLAEAFSLE